MSMFTKSRNNQGVTTLLVLLYMGLFVLILSTISGYALTQSRYGRALAAREQALHVAEAGLEYYRWFLAHNPSIASTGTGLMSTTYTETDPETGAVGDATINATASLQCGAVQWIDIESTGIAYADRQFPRTITARYMRPTVAEYSYVVNTNVWAGPDRDIRGPYHSNGGVRMDGGTNSNVSSSVTDWNCTSSYGCAPSQTNAPGVMGSGANPELWQYPVPTIDFALIDVNFTDLKTKAQTGGGVYYPPASGSANSRGYRIIFNADGTYTLYRVTSTDGYPSSSSQYGNTSQFSVIKTQTLIGTYAVPSDCSLMYFEDRVWIEGTVNAKVTVVAATAAQGTTPDAFLNNNIYYNAYDGTDGLTVIAERNVLIPLIVPDNMEIHGIFVAQSGHYGRDYFSINSIPTELDQYVSQTSLRTIGTVVSNGRTGTSWICGGIFCSGFQTRYDYYDQLLALSPPPFTPVTSTDFGFALWREKYGR